MDQLRESLRPLIALLAFTLALASAPAAANAAEPLAGLVEQTASSWRSLEIEGFRARFPGVPRHVVNRSETVLGAIQASNYIYSTAESLFAVERHRLPRLARALAPASLILSRTKDELLVSRDAVELSYDVLEADDRTSRRLAYRRRDDDSVSTSEFHLVGRDLYIVTAESGASESGRSVIRRFIDSFRLLHCD